MLLLIGAGMIAIDTNILVRIVTNDDPVQAQRAVLVLQNQAVFISKTVILELEWVLHFSYSLKRNIIQATLQKILATDGFTIEQSSAVERSLLWYEKGMDFADALHVACSLHTDHFFSFDKKLIKKASQVNVGLTLLEP